MTGREKAYFKRFATLFNDNENKNYLRLYDYLIEKNASDESLEQAFSGLPMAKYLSSEKNYLLQKLLMCLTVYHFDNTADRKIMRLILYSQLLLQREIRDKGLKYLQQAKMLAYRHEKFTLIGNILEVEQEILFKEGILDFSLDLTKLNEERLRIFEIVSNLSHLRLLRERARELQYIESFHSNPQDFPDIFHSDLMVSIENAKSLRAKDHWYYLREQHLYLLQNFNDAQTISLEYFEFLNSHPHIFNVIKRISALGNLLFICALNRDQGHFRIALQHLSQLSSSSEAHDIYINYLVYSRTLDLHYRIANHKEAFGMVEEIEKYVRAHLDDLAVVQANYILFVLVRACIEFSKFEKALDWMNSWKQNGVLKYTLVHNRLLALIIYFELGWDQLLEAAMVSAYRNLRSQRVYDKLASTIIGFCRK